MGTQPHVQGDLGLSSDTGIFLRGENRRGKNKGTQISVDDGLIKISDPGYFLGDINLGENLLIR